MPPPLQVNEDEQRLHEREQHLEQEHREAKEIRDRSDEKYRLFLEQWKQWSNRPQAVPTSVQQQ